MAKKTDQSLPVAHEPANTALEHDPEARMIAERVAAIAKHAKWDLPIANNRPLHGEKLQAWILRREEKSAVDIAERGIAFKLLKRELGHGSYMGWLTDHGINPRTAAQSVQVANLLLGLPPDKSATVADLPVRKLCVLATAPIPMITDMFNAGALDDAASMSVEQLRELVKLRKEIERQAEREDNLNETIARQQEELRRVRALPEMHQAALELRRAVLEETEALRANAHTLQAVMDRVTLLPHDMPRAEVDAIVHPLMYALQGLHATAAALFSRGYDVFADYQADVDVFPPVLESHEAARAQQRHTDFMRAADRRAVNRQIDLAPAAKRGRGRPRKGS